MRKCEVFTSGQIEQWQKVFATLESAEQFAEMTTLLAMFPVADSQLLLPALADQMKNLGDKPKEPKTRLA